MSWVYAPGMCVWWLYLILCSPSVQVWVLFQACLSGIFLPASQHVARQPVSCKNHPCQVKQWLFLTLAFYGCVLRCDVLSVSEPFRLVRGGFLTLFSISSNIMWEVSLTTAHCLVYNRIAHAHVLNLTKTMVKNVNQCLFTSATVM